MNEKLKFPSQDEINIFFSSYIREEAYKNGDSIYSFMKKMGVGESEYGKIMDAVGKSEAVHRLYGHHLIFDFPIQDTSNINSFLDHLLSDLFTKQGLPIFPGEILDQAGVLKYFKSLNANQNWNFVNGFDLLAGYLSISTAVNSLKCSYDGECLSNDKDIVINLVLNLAEIAVGLYSSNIFLLIGSAGRMVSTVWKISNNETDLYMMKELELMSVDHFLENISFEKELESLSFDNFIKKLA